VSTAPIDTLHEVLLRGRRRLMDGGLASQTADVDVEVLARHVLHCDRATLLVRRREAAPDGFELSLSKLLARRATREPVAYITGHREFWGLDFAVSADVLVPRPESEIVVEEALEALRAPGESRRPFVLDVGTGSGCLAVAIAAHAPAARIIATDVSTRALRVAQRNAERLAPGRIGFVAGDLLAPLSVTAWVDLLVSNPPYVPRAATNVMLDVERHEPSTALFGGPDGLAHVRRLVQEAARVVRPDGWLIFEFGDGQEDDVRAIVSAVGGWSVERVRLDLQQIPRVLVARRK
jgi:release factor glutamine methyltransferase